MNTSKDSIFITKNIKDKSKFNFDFDFEDDISKLLDVKSINYFNVKGTFNFDKTDLKVHLLLSFSIDLYEIDDLKVISQEIEKDYDIILSVEVNDYYDYILLDSVNIYDICFGLLVLEIDNLLQKDI
jgi:hypothetical protein